jgi:DNA-binding FadR family transcriptional regulator
MMHQLIPDCDRPTAPANERPFDQVVETIAIGIVSGRFAAGDIIPNEAELDGHVVSRTAYREAIKFLSAKGLIEAKPRSGTRVRPRQDWNLLDPDILEWTLRGGATVDFVRDLFELRSTIEPRAARLAAERRSEEQLIELRDALQRMHALVPFTPGCVGADIRFHEILFEASGNRALACLKPVVATTIRGSLNIKKATDRGEFRRSLQDHRRIYKAVAMRDAAMAEAQSIVLIFDSLRTTQDALEERGTR